MRKIIFLSKLKANGKLELVEPSVEVEASYREKSESNLISAKILLDNARLEEAVALTYYSMYNMLVALLFKAGIKCENHAASIILLKELFGLDNSDIFSAKKDRIDKQYYTDFKVAKEEVADSIKSAEVFNRELYDFISKVSKTDVEEYREKFSELT